MELYKLTDNFREAIAGLQQLDLDEETYNDTLEGLEGEVTDKMINVGLHIKNLRSDVDRLKTAKAEFDRRIKTTQKQLDFYEYYLDQNMLKAGIDKAGNEYVDIKYRKLPDTVECETAPIEYSTVVPESTRPDKRKIKEALDKGESLSFATLVTNRKGLSIK